MYSNYVSIKIPSFSSNESSARSAVAAFCASLNPTIEEISDIKTAVSEAVTNSIIHGYEGRVGDIVIDCRIKKQMVEIIIEDYGCGISNVDKAKEPLYTTKPELERSGMGFAVMETFMDDLVVLSEKDIGTKVILRKTIGIKNEKNSNM